MKPVKFNTTYFIEPYQLDDKYILLVPEQYGASGLLVPLAGLLREAREYYYEHDEDGAYDYRDYVDEYINHYVVRQLEAGNFIHEEE